MAVHRDTYVDSVVQLSGTRAMRAVDGVEWASAAMATPGALGVLVEEGFEPPAAGANDLLVAVRAASPETVAAAGGRGGRPVRRPGRRPCARTASANMGSPTLTTETSPGSATDGQ